jgi:PAS domain S-box-containing protein
VSRVGTKPTLGTRVTRAPTTALAVRSRASQGLGPPAELLQGTLDALSAHIAVLDEHGEILMTNRAWGSYAEANGGAASEAAGANYLSVCDTAVDDECSMLTAAGLRAILAGAENEFTLEYPCHGPGVERWFKLRATRHQGPGPTRVVVVHDDITERRVAEAELAKQAALFDDVEASVIGTDAEGRVIGWSDGAERLYGWTRAEALGQPALDLAARADRKAAEEMVEKLRLDGRWDGELTGSRKDGSTFPAFVRNRLTVDDGGRVTGRVAVVVDMTERVAAERALLSATNYMRAVADSMGEGLFTLDPEGHLIYMNETAERLLGWPAEELQGQLMHEATHSLRADGTRLAKEDCPILGAHRDGVTVRMEDEVFVRRDGSMLPIDYTAAPFRTDDGVGGCVVVFEDITERKARQASLETDAKTLSWIARIQEALAQDRFVLYAQPIIDLSSGEVIQRELLLRMREKNGEVVAPGVFLPIAEQWGLIGDIDRWVIERAIEIAAAGGPVELNLSAHSIGDPTILSDIESSLAKTGLDPRSLVFEITETALIANVAAAGEFADRLHDLGCKLALDDFGTGYGGFTYLKQFPLDILKIDIEFVRDLPTNPASEHVIAAVVSLARAFGLKTIAEGVEDAQTLDLLRELGVDFAQGYHIARPGPIEDVPGSLSMNVNTGSAS